MYYAFKTICMIDSPKIKLMTIGSHILDAITLLGTCICNLFLHKIKVLQVYIL